jgi:preprotein translocase subunit SecY
LFTPIPLTKEVRLRTSAQRKKRSVFYRIINVVFILVGAVHVAMTVMNRGATDHAMYVLQMEISILWLVIAAMWVAFSRIWGELSEEAAARK